MGSMMSRTVVRVCLAALCAFSCGLSALVGDVRTADAASRIKDLANIEGVRQNQLIGYGLVVGLNGTGDTLNHIPFTRQSLQAMLERLGVNIRGQQLRTGNVAAVMVTANLPPFGTQGTQFVRDGKPYQILSGAIHFQRIPRAYWKDRLQKARALGLNTIETYVFWNLVEPQQGKFDFSANNDVAAFVRDFRRSDGNVVAGRRLGGLRDGQLCGGLDRVGHDGVLPNIGGRPP